MNNELKETTIKALLCGDDMTEHAAARIFLRELIEATYPEPMRITLPIARRLMSYPGWHLKLTVRDVTRYCSEREWVLTLLRALPQQGKIDVEGEYLSGMADDLRRKLELG